MFVVFLDLGTFHPAVTVGQGVGSEEEKAGIEAGNTWQVKQ